MLKKNLAESPARLSLAKVFKTLKMEMSDQHLWSFVEMDFKKHMEELAVFPIRLETKSNLWPNLAQKNNADVGLQCNLFSIHEAKIAQLVNHRNDIAHGNKLIIKDAAQLQEFENAAFLVMHDLAVAVVGCLDTKSYLKIELAPIASE